MKFLHPEMSLSGLKIIEKIHYYSLKKLKVRSPLFSLSYMVLSVTPPFFFLTVPIYFMVLSRPRDVYLLFLLVGLFNRSTLTFFLSLQSFELFLFLFTDYNSFSFGGYVI